MPRRAWLTRFIEFLPTNYSQVCQERSGRARFARAHTVWVIWNKVNPVKLIQNIRAKTRACHMRFGTQAWQGVNIPKIWNPIVSDRIENHASVKVSNYRECQITFPPSGLTCPTKILAKRNFVHWWTRPTNLPGTTGGGKFHTLCKRKYFPYHFLCFKINSSLRNLLAF